MLAFLLALSIFRSSSLMRPNYLLLSKEKDSDTSLLEYCRCSDIVFHFYWNEWALPTEVGNSMSGLRISWVYKVKFSLENKTLLGVQAPTSACDFFFPVCDSIFLPDAPCEVTRDGSSVWVFATCVIREYRVESLAPSFGLTYTLLRIWGVNQRLWNLCLCFLNLKKQRSKMSVGYF